MGKLYQEDEREQVAAGWKRHSARQAMLGPLVPKQISLKRFFWEEKRLCKRGRFFVVRVFWRIGRRSSRLCRVV